MRIRVVLLASALLAPLGTSPLAAQHLVPDSLFRARAPARPILRIWEAGLVGSEKQGVYKLIWLRRDGLDRRFPGLLDAVLESG